MSEDKLKPVFMFIWRFLFTFMSLGYLIYVLVSSGGNPHPDIYSFFVWVFIGAIAFDLKKMGLKSGIGLHSHFGKIKPYNSRHSFTPGAITGNTYNAPRYSDRFIPGTTAWNMHSYSRDWDPFVPGTRAWRSRH